MTYVIMTAKGWRPLLPPMAPTPPHPKWGSFGGARPSTPPSPAPGAEALVPARKPRRAKR